MVYLMSDLHGDYQSFCKMLVKINFTLFDCMYILGDVVDKGEENLCLLDFICRSDNIFLIKGNHEYLLERYLKGTVTAEMWDACGGRATRKEVDMLPEGRKSEILAFLEALPVYQILTIDNTEYFLTHSGYHGDFEITDSKTRTVDIQKSVKHAVLWDQEQYLFSNDIHFLSSELQFDRRIVVGHYPTLDLLDCGQACIYHGEKYIDIDTGNERRTEGGRLACLRLNDGKEYYV